MAVSGRTNLLWFAAFVLTGPGYLLLLGAVKTYTASSVLLWWEWLLGPILMGLGFASAVVLIRHHRRETTRNRELDRLWAKWEDRALRGEAPLSRSGRPEDERQQAASLRAAMLVQQAQADPARRRGPFSMKLAFVGSCVRATGVPLFCLALTVGVFGGPGSFVLWILVLMFALQGVGIILVVIGASRASKEQSRKLARLRQAVGANASRLP